MIPRSAAAWGLAVALASGLASAPARGSADRLVQAITLSDAGRWPEARTLLEALVAEEPEHHRALWNMGLLEMHEARYDRAIGWFEQAIALDDSRAEYHLWRGYGYARRLEQVSIFRKPFLAVRVRRSFERAYELDPSSPEARRALIAFHSRAPAIVGGSKSRAEELEHPPGE